MQMNKHSMMITSFSYINQKQNKTYTHTHSVQKIEQPSQQKTLVSVSDIRIF